MGYESRRNQKESAMIRRVVLDGSATHKLYFRLILEAFLTRGSAARDEKVTKEERRSDGKILRGLKAISDPVGDEPKDGEMDGRPRALAATGGVIEMEQPEFKRLQMFVERTQWQSGVSDVSTDLEDWLDTAEKAEA